MFQTGHPGPGPVQIVPDIDRQATAALDLQLDLVAALERVQAAMVGAGGNYIAGLERMDHELRHSMHARNLVRHIIGVEVLHQVAVYPEFDVQILRVLELVSSHEIRPDRREGGPGLGLRKNTLKGGGMSRAEPSMKLK